MSSFDSALPARDTRGVLTAVEYAECPICFEPLCQQACGAMYSRNGIRVCTHYFHLDCLTSLRAQSCPLCRQEFSTVQPIPKVTENPEAWFRAMDANGDGELSYEEVLEGLRTSIPVDWQRIETDVDRLWNTWDPDRSGSISLAEFLDRGTGLIEYLYNQFPRGEHQAPPPLLLDGPDVVGWIESCTAFFEYWDLDRSGSLEQGEMTRALVKTFRLHQGYSGSVAEALENIWPIFDLDGNGILSQEEFTARDGLAEVIVATIRAEMRDRSAAL